MLRRIDAALYGRCNVVNVEFWVERDVPRICCRSWFDNKQTIIIEPGQPFDTELPPQLFQTAWAEYQGLTKSINHEVRFYTREKARQLGLMIVAAFAVFLGCQAWCAAFHDHAPMVAALLADLELTPPT